jgi:hypothetical protein
MTDWLPGALAGFFSGTGGSLLVLLIDRWLRRRGSLRYIFGSAEAEQYLMRGKWNPAGTEPILDVPRFLEFRVPIVVENRSDSERTLSIIRVHLGDNPPEFKDGGWCMRGSCLQTLGAKFIDSAGEQCNPVRIPPHGYAHVTVVGTASTPVYHAGPFLSWRCLFIDIVGTPQKIPPLVRVFDGWPVTLQKELQPTFPIPAEYRHV